VRKRLGGVKILAAGELKVALKVSAHRISAGAQAQIEKAGGSIELIGPQTADKTPRRHKEKAVKAEVDDQPTSKAEKGAAAKAGAEASDAEAATETTGTSEEAEPEADGGEPESSPEE